jgi:glycosyltransferase involved in cell wall biosynthesis
MRILILSNKPPYPPKDGGSIAVMNLAKGMANEGNSVHILSLNTSKHRVESADIPVFKNLEFTFVDIDTSIHFTSLLRNLCFSRLPYNAERFISNVYLLELTKLLTSETFDIIQLEGPYLSFCIDTIKQFSNAKISLRSHNIEFEIWERTALMEKNLVKKHYLKLLSKRIKRFEIDLINTYDCILPITARDGEILNTLGNTKPAFVVPVGVDTSTLPNFESVNYNSIFYIGALDWIPNQEGLIWFVANVWPLVYEQNKQVVLHVAGRNAPIWLINMLKVSSIQYHGEVENAYEFMSNKGIMIVPLFSGSGMRVKIIEGMALGKAIITTSLGAEGIDVTDNENILISNEISDFTKKIIDLISNNQYTKEIADRAKIFIQKNYDNSIIAKKMLEFYNKQLYQ